VIFTRPFANFAFAKPASEARRFKASYFSSAAFPPALFHQQPFFYMKTRTFFAALFLPLAGLAQETTGITFEPGSWKEVVAKAKAEKKLIFLDTYTTWCGPCKWMDKNVYPDVKVGQKFNAAFVNYKIDAEKGEGITLARKYQVTAYPTYLFVSADESLVYRTIGSRPAEKFIEEADKAVEAGKEKPVSVWESEYANGQRDATFLKSYLQKRHKLGLPSDQVLDEYLRALPADSLNTTATLRLLATPENPPLVGSKAYALLLEHRKDAADIPALQGTLSRGVLVAVRRAMKEKNKPLFEQALAANEQLSEHKPSLATQENLMFRMDFYKATNETGPYVEATRLYLTSYLIPRNLDSLRRADVVFFEKMTTPYTSGKKDSTTAEGKVQYEQIKRYARHMNVMELSSQLNRAAWGFYETVSDKKALQEALSWSKRSLDLSPDNTAFIDTYAHLLYKTGQPKEAMQWQQKAIDLAKVGEPEGVKGYEETLEKMKSKTL